MPNLMLIIFILIFLTLAIDADLLLRGSNDTIETQTLFQSPTPSNTSVRVGGFVLLPIKYNNETQSCVARTAGKLRDQSDGRELFMLVRWYDAQRCKLTTFAQLWPILDEWRRSLPAFVPLPRTVFVLLNKKYPGTPGNPSFEAYSAKSSSIPDGLPSNDLEVVLVPNDQRKVFMGLIEDADVSPDALTWEYTVTLGPWNEVFMSAWYLAIVYSVMSIDALGILYSLYGLGMTLKQKKFKFNVRAGVFFLALVGFVMYVVTIPLRLATYANRVTESVSTYLISLSFHLLLYLWSVFLMQVQRSRAIYVFRGLIAFGALVATLAFITAVVMANVVSNDSVDNLGTVIGYLLPATQTVIGATFLYYAANFFMRRKEAGKISQSTVSALTRLAQVAVIAFVGYFAVASTNLNFVVQSNGSPGLMAALTLIRLLSCSVRGLAILTVMGIRQQERTGHTTSSRGTAFSSTASSVSHSSGSGSRRVSSASTIVAPTSTLAGKGPKSVALGTYNSSSEGKRVSDF